MLLHPGGLLLSLAESVWAPAIIFALALSFQRLFRLQKRSVPWGTLSCILCGILTLAALTYLFLPVLFEDAETDIACISAILLRGQSVYPSMDSAHRYVLLYGPVTYLAHVPFYWLFGENLPAFKLLGFCCFLASLFGLYRICRHYSSPGVALVGLGFANLVFFRYIGVEFWGRIDPLVLLMTVLPIWALIDAPDWLAVITAGAAIGIEPNLKASAIAYLLPIAGLLLISKGWRLALATFALAAFLFAAPFALPEISAQHYLETLKAAAAHGLVPEFLLRNLQYSALLIAPAIAILLWSRPPVADVQKSYLALIAAGLLVTCFLGAKSGAGSYHLLPFVAPILHLYFWRRSELVQAEADRPFTGFAIAWVLTTLALSDQHLKTVWREFRFAGSGSASIAQIEETEARLRGHTLAVGVGATFDDPRTRYEFAPVFSGQPFPINGAAIRDLQFAGIAIPSSTIQSIERCETEVWVIPHGQEPFSAGNSYYDHFHPAFEQGFRQAFSAHYDKTAEGAMYDNWTCRR